MPADAAFCPACGQLAGAPAQPDTLETLTFALKDRYRVERMLGRGGMATVFLAHDLRHERDVAIKVLHPELAASLGAERFEREIKVAAKLQHPHILTLYDSGAADGLLFYVMPFVQGESLRDKLDREQMLPVEEALTITLEVADALGHAHSLGIVHRDIKPENIMLSGGHALVADFGIARALTGDAREQKLTQTGTSIGTPLYMSPEQAAGDEVGATADLYSLGCVTYEMLTGAPPFTGANARAIMARHTMEMVPSVRVVRDTVPEEMEDAIFAVLSKVPADRPKTAAQFAELITGGAGTTTTRRVAARSRMTTARSGPQAAFKRRPRWLVPAAVAATLAAAAIGAWQLMKPAAGSGAGGLDRTRLAVLYFDDLSQDHSLGYLADGLTEGLIGALARGDLNVVPRSGAALYRGSPVSDDSVARGLQAGTLVRGSVEPRGANVRVQYRLVEGASGSDISRGSFEMPAANAMAIVDSLVEQVARTVRTELGAELRRREQRQQTRSPDAWVLVQRAERLHKQGDSAAAQGDTIAFATFYERADSQAAQAEALDGRWLSPIVLRAGLSYGRSRAYFEPGAVRPWVQQGLAHVERALAIDREDPDALALRGTMRYWSFLVGVEPNSVRADSLLASARRDLETAVRIDPRQAGAWATLSHLYANDPGRRGSDIVLAAGEALRRDAYLSNAATIQSRLFFAYYDIGDSVKASEACAEGRRRFKDHPDFTECRLWLLTMGRQTAAAPARAWQLADSLVALTGPGDSAFYRRSSRLMVAAVLARSGLTDSAFSVATSVQRNSDVDPSADLANISAFVFTLLDMKGRAVEQLGSYLAVNPQRRNSLATDPGWWFTPLKGDPGFELLVAASR